MLSIDPEKIRQNARESKTDDLLDRVTAYRAGMEPVAIEIIEEELQRRGIDAEEISRRAEKYGKGSATRKCSFCPRPAVEEGWDWHRLFGKIPLFPRPMAWCEEHRPR